MAMTTGLLVLAAMGAEGPAGDCDGAMEYQVRVLTLDGLQWRADAYPRLRPVARQGTSSVWTADRALAEALAASARSVATGVKPGRSGEPVVALKSPVYYQGHWDRVADGPINRATTLAWRPETGRFDEGFRAQVGCRKLDQGILALVRIEESHVNAIHKVMQAETFKTPNGFKVDFVPADGDGRVVGFQSVQKSADGKESTLGCYVQVPEVSNARIEGEWLVPPGSVLLVTLGVDTVADEKGMAVVRERVAIVEFADPSKEKDEPKATAAPAASRVEAVTAVAPPVLVGDLPMPAVPARDTPEGYDPSGNLVELPPLPEGLAATDLDRIRPAPDQPSPQALAANQSADPQVAQAGFTPDAVANPAPAIRDGLSVASLPSSCFLRKMIASGMLADYDLDIETEVDGRTLRVTVNDVGRCDDPQCKAEAAEAARLDARPVSQQAEVKCPEVADAGCPASSSPSFVAKLLAAFLEKSNGDDSAPAAPAVPAPKALDLGVNVANFAGQDVSTVEADLTSALKNPGKTETTLVPLPGRMILELKATVVPAAAVPAGSGPITRSPADKPSRR